MVCYLQTSHIDGMQDPRLSPAQKAELEVEIEAEVSRVVIHMVILPWM